LIARDTKGVTLEDLAKFFDREASGISKAAARLDSRMRTILLVMNILMYFVIALNMQYGTLLGTYSMWDANDRF
jgi:hypothetical protein